PSRHVRSFTDQTIVAGANATESSGVRRSRRRVLAARTAKARGAGRHRVASLAWPELAQRRRAGARRTRDAHQCALPRAGTARRRMALGLRSARAIALSRPAA